MTTQQSSVNKALVRIGHIGDGYDYLDKPTFFSIIAVRNISLSENIELVVFIQSLRLFSKTKF